VIQFGGEKVTPGDQFVAFHGGVVVDRPSILAESLDIVLDTNNKPDSLRWCGTLC
jgi:hypothetical protein